MLCIHWFNFLLQATQFIKKNKMKKYISLIFISAVISVSCNQPSKETIAEKIAPIDITVMPVRSELMKVSALSPAELKDDSVFTDGSIPASWNIAGINNVKGLKLFIKQLQQWVITNDKEMLASAVQFPLNNTIKTKEGLISNYDAVFTKEVKLSLATTNFSQLFRNARGVMLDAGKIWLAQKGNNFKIIAINYSAEK